MECAHLEQRKREREQREMYTARFCFLSYSLFSRKERNPTNALLLLARETDRQTEREEEGIASSSSIVTHRSLSDHFFQNLHFFFLFVCFVYFAERKKRNDVDAEEQRDTNDDD